MVTPAHVSDACITLARTLCLWYAWLKRLCQAGSTTASKTADNEQRWGQWCARHRPYCKRPSSTSDAKSHNLNAGLHLENILHLLLSIAGTQQKNWSSDLLDLMPTENNQLQRWIRLYVSIRDVTALSKELQIAQVLLSTQQQKLQQAKDCCELGCEDCMMQRL
eukprot:3780533-Amphidinium_carterae.2